MTVDVLFDKTLKENSFVGLLVINPEYIFWKSTLKNSVSWVQNKAVKQKKVLIIECKRSGLSANMNQT